MRKEFLMQLNADPVWQEIVKDIIEGRNVPKFNPNDPKLSPDQQKDRWIHSSGRAFENDRICQILNIGVKHD